MKKLLLLMLFILSIQAFPCGTSTPAQVNACTVNKALRYLLEKAHPGVPFKIQKKNGEFDVRSRYERLVMEGKPSFNSLKIVLSEWKAERLIFLNLKSRARNIKHLRSAMIKCGVNVPNKALYLKGVLDKIDEPAINCLESKQIEIEAEIQLVKDAEVEEEALIQQLKGYDCSGLSKFNKLVCSYLKTKL